MGTNSHPTEDGSPRFVEATQTSLAILQLLKARGALSLGELAEELACSKSTVHRHVTTLEHDGFIAKTADGYQLGLLFLDYGIQVQRNNPVFQAAKDKVDELAELVEEKVWCMVAEGGLGCFMYHRQAKEVFQTYTRVGFRGHLHAFSAGKAMLAYFPEEQVDAIIERHGLPAYSANTITERDALREELAAVREAGVAFNQEESVKGVNSVAAPIRLEPDKPVGSICVAGPAKRLRGTYYREEIPEILLGVTNEIEVRLEYGSSVREDGISEPSLGQN